MCCWGSRLLPDVSKDLFAFIFKVKQKLRRLFDPWNCSKYKTPKHRTLVTQRLSLTSQKKRIVSSTAERTSSVAETNSLSAITRLQNKHRWHNLTCGVWMRSSAILQLSRKTADVPSVKQTTVSGCFTAGIIAHYNTCRESDARTHTHTHYWRKETTLKT